MSTHHRLAPLWWFTAVLLVPAAFIWSRAGSLSAIQAPTSVPWWLLALGFAAADLLVAHITVEGESHALDLGALPLLVGLVYCRPVDLLLASVAGLVVFFILRRPRIVKLFVNLAVNAISVGLSVLTFHAVAGDASPVSWRGWLASYAAVLVYALAATMLVTISISLTIGRWD